jgi:hypothetical protein
VGLLILFAAVLLVFRKYVVRKEFWIWSGFMAFPLAVVTGKQANIFASDTYLLIPLLGFMILVAVTVSRLVSEKMRASMISKIAFALLAIGFIGESISISTSYSSDSTLWERAYRIEKTPLVLAQKTMLAFDAAHYDEALYFALLLKEFDLGTTTMELIGHCVYSRPDWDWAKKAAFLESQGTVQYPLFQYFLGLTYEMQGEFPKAYAVLLSTAAQAGGLGILAEEVAAQTVFLCKSLKKTDCESVKKNFRQNSEQRVFSWNEKKYVDQLSKLEESAMSN